MIQKLLLGEIEKVHYIILGALLIQDTRTFTPPIFAWVFFPHFMHLPSLLGPKSKYRRAKNFHRLH